MQEEVAKETGVNFINVYDIMMKKPEQERCDLQKATPTAENCDFLHYGKEYYVEELHKELIQPELSKMKLAQATAQKFLDEAKVNITSAVVANKNVSDLTNATSLASTLTSSNHSKSAHIQI